MAITLVQTVGNNATGANTLLNLAMATTTAGNLMIVAIGATTGAITNVIDDGGNTYFKIDAYTYADTSTMICEFWAAQNITHASFTISVQHSAGSISAIAREYSGLLKNGVLGEVKHTADTVGGTTPTSGSRTVRRQTELLIGWCVDDFGTLQTFTAGSGFGNVSAQQNSSVNLAVEDQITTAAFVGSAGFTLGSSNKSGCGIVTFKAMPSGVPPNALRPAPFKPGLAR